MPSLNNSQRDLFLKSLYNNFLNYLKEVPPEDNKSDLKEKILQKSLELEKALWIKNGSSIEKYKIDAKQLHQSL